MDGILVTDPVNVRYLTGFTGTSGFVLLTGKHSIFATDFRYREQSRLEVKGFKIVIENTERSKEIKALCERYGVVNLGFEDNHLTYSFFKKLQNQKLRVTPAGAAVESLRIIKSEQEIVLIRTAVKRAEEAFKKLQPHIRIGITESSLALKFEALIKAEGCKKLPFDVILASGPNSALPHAKPSARKLKQGDLVVFDWGGECEGYFSDMTRTVLMHHKNMSKQRELYYNVHTAQLKALKAVRSNIKSAVVDAAARDYINELGFEEEFGHGTGHGVGMAVHEKPVVSWRNSQVLQENMVFTVEPGIYLPGFGGVRIEDMVKVTKDGADVLTSLPKKLNVIER